jgi:hypothetical protein
MWIPPLRANVTRVKNFFLRGAGPWPPTGPGGAFTSYKAGNFSHMFTGAPNLFIGEVAHKTCPEINEAGLAAAVGWLITSAALPTVTN